MDECSMSNEISLLIPLHLKHKKLIMVGDEKQLNNVISNEYCKDINYNKSIFERFIVYYMFISRKME